MAAQDSARKVLLPAGGMAAAIVAPKVVRVVWVAVTGHEPPEDPADPQVAMRQAVAVAVTTAVVAGVVRLVIARGTRRVTSKLSSGRSALGAGAA
jgi:fumarate reductase subunit D